MTGGFCALLQFKWFQTEVLQAMEKKVELDEEYIQVGLPAVWTGLIQVGVSSFSGGTVLSIHRNWLV